MRAGPFVILIAVVAIAGSCGSSNEHNAGDGAAEPSSAPVTTSANTATTTAPSTPTMGSGPTGLGERSFSVSGAVLTSSDWLTVGLHPTTVPISLTASGAVPLEVCPAGLDGQLDGSSWPPWFHFPSCVTVDPSGATPLPTTDGGTHVTFAIKVAASAAPTTVAVTIDYTAADSFFEVFTPADAPRTDLSVTYEPRSSTTAAQVTPVGQVTPAPGYRVALTQGGRSLSSAANCDFPTEFEGCVATIAGEAVVARVTGPRGRVILEAAWK